MKPSFRLLPALLPAALLCGSSLTAAAQTAADTTASTASRAAVPRHALRLDLGVVWGRNFSNSIQHPGSRFTLPVVIGYEQQLRPRLSASAELHAYGSSLEYRRVVGATLQGRYYLYQGRHTGLVGAYVAPSLNYRRVWLPAQPVPTAPRNIGGAGLLFGVQYPFGRHWALDAAFGATAWRELGSSSQRPGSAERRVQTFYEKSPVLFDGRLSVGYRF